MDVFSSSPHPPSKRIRLQENEKKSPLPHALQGEIARLGSRFSVWPSQTPSTKHSCALLKCSLSKCLIDVNTIQYNLHHRIVQYNTVHTSYVRTASYGPSFFSPSFHGPSAKCVGHENREGKNEDP